MLWHLILLPAVYAQLTTQTAEPVPPATSSAIPPTTILTTITDATPPSAVFQAATTLATTRHNPWGFSTNYDARTAAVPAESSVITATTTTFGTSTTTSSTFTTGFAPDAATTTGTRTITMSDTTFTTGFTPLATTTFVTNTTTVALADTAFHTGLTPIPTTAGTGTTPSGTTSPFAATTTVGFTPIPTLANYTILPSTTSSFWSTIVPTAEVNQARVIGNAVVEDTETEANVTMQVRQCFCTEAEQCKRQGRRTLMSCFDSCDQELSVFGNDTTSYLDCFERDPEGFTQAEECLEDALGEFCIKGNVSRYIDLVDYDGYVKAKFLYNKAPETHFHFRHQAHRALSGFHQFYQCARHCVHKKMVGCYKERGCSIRLPSLHSYSRSMTNCARSHPQVARSLRSTCLCLLHKKGLHQLLTSCVYMGNSYFVKMLK